MIKVIPAILTNDPTKAIDLLKQAEGVVDRVQIDIIDGVFADNRTVDPMVFQEVDTGLLLDYHLMVKEPVNWVEKSVRAGGDRIIGHIEMMSDKEAFINKVLAMNATPGFAIDLDTPIIELDPDLLGEIGVIIVMSVKAGFGGLDFQHEVLNKITKLHEIRQEKGYQYKICDDGGVTMQWIDDVRRKGVDEVSVGTRLFNGDLAENVKQYTEAAER